MGERNYIIKGREDVEITTVTVWFALSYLYAKNIDNKECSYLKASNYNKRIDVIVKSGQFQIRSWIYYAINFLEYEFNNSGGLSIEKQKQYANELSYLKNIKTK